MAPSASGAVGLIAVAAKPGGRFTDACAAGFAGAFARAPPSERAHLSCSPVPPTRGLVSEAAAEALGVVPGCPTASSP